MVLIKKAVAGSDSYGNVWATDGAVVDVAPEHAADLLSIPDGGFTDCAPAHLPTPDPSQLVDLGALAAAVATQNVAAVPPADLSGLAAREGAASAVPVEPAPVEPAVAAEPDPAPAEADPADPEAGAAALAVAAAEAVAARALNTATS